MPEEAKIRTYAQMLHLLSTQEASMSVSGWESLARAYVALHNLVVTKSLDRPLGEQGMHLERIKHLHAACLQQYKEKKDFVTRCRLLYIMQLLTNKPFTPYAPWKEECFNIGEEFIRESMSSHRNSTLWEWLWCIAYQYYPPGEESKDEYGFRRFKKHLSTWVSTFDEQAGWEGVSLLDALKRIDLLNANSDLFADDTYDDAIGLIYAHYRSLVPVSPTTHWENLCAMGLLYEQSQNFTAYPFDKSKKEASIQGLEESLDMLPAFSDKWIYVFSYLMYDLCENINDEDVYKL